MRYFIKYMVCDKCKTLVTNAMNKAGISFVLVSLGELIVKKIMTPVQFNLVQSTLNKSGLELLGGPENRNVEKLLNTIDDLVDFSAKGEAECTPDYLSMKLNQPFGSLNTLFSQIECVSIEKYIEEHKILKIKEMLSYHDFNLKEIANLMHYSSVYKLTGHFRSLTGLSPLFYRQLRSRTKYSPCCN